MTEKQKRRKNMLSFITEKYVKMINAIDALKKDERGQTLVEYALLLVLIAIVVIAAVTLVGQRANNAYSNIANHLGS
jgi:pilus assembly protein Flp/PilA